MMNKLRSHLKSEKGFTLIELLVVIAIIAVLVVIAIVAINPVGRINDGRDRAARSNVRAVGTLISTCMTRALAGDLGAPGDGTQCNTNALVATNGQGTVPAGVTVSGNATDVCAEQNSRAGVFFHYRHSEGNTAQNAATEAC